MTRLTLYTTPDRTRHFLIPEDADLPPGDLALRTSTGQQRSVDPAAAALYEVTEDEAKAWAKEQLGKLFGEMRGSVLDFTEHLKAKTAKLREENRKTLDEAAAGASPELREAAARIRSTLSDLGRAIERMARENRERAEAEEGNTEAQTERGDGVDAAADEGMVEDGAPDDSGPDNHPTP